MKNLKLKSLLLALGLGFGATGVVAGPDATACASYEEACEEGDYYACKLLRYCR